MTITGKTINQTLRSVSILLYILLVFNNSTFGQHSIQGKILDKNDEGAIEMANIRLLHSMDSSYISGCPSDEKGFFTFKKILNGSYILEVRFLGYNAFFRNVTLSGKPLLLKNIYLEKSDLQLKEFEVTGMTAQMSVRNDTVEYNSAAFKTAENAAVEELLQKLPGVVIDADGKITIHGEEIKKIRVDGKKFFGGDIQMATKNIPVDLIDKIQVIDQKSEMAQLTGFEDDNTERIINLTFKPNRKKGLFGNVTTGAGMDTDKDFRYNENVYLNMLNGNAQTTITAGANNANKQRSGKGRTGISGGTIETQNFGINNNTEFSKMLKIGGNASYNHTSNQSETSSERESWLKDVIYNNFNESFSKKANNQANVQLELEWKIDTLTTLIIQPELNYSQGISFGQNMYEYFADGDSISWGKSQNSSESKGVNADLNILFSRKSKIKKGRTFTLNVGGSFNDSKSQGENRSDKTTTDTTIIVDQHTQNTSTSSNANMRISYVEPLWNLSNFLETSITSRLSKRSSEKLQYKKGENDQYNLLDSVYSNRFENNFYNEALELNFRHQEIKYNYMIGLKAEPSQTYSTAFYKNTEVIARTNEVINIAPIASYRYNFGRKHFARLEYRGRTSQPGLEQMQPVRNNNNLMHETIGNPSLNPSFEHSLRLMYTSYNAQRYSSFSSGLNGSMTKDALVNNSIYDKTGKQYSQTINSVNAPFNVNGNIIFNTPIIKNRLQFNTRTELSFQKRFGYSDRNKTMEAFNPDGNLRLGNLSKTQNSKATQSLSLTFTTDIIEIGTQGSVRYSNTQNSLNASKNQVTKDWTGSGNFNLHLPFNVVISNDLNYTKRQGYSNFENNELVWNASIDKTMFRKRGTLSLKLYDILQQKLTIRESIGDNYRQLSRFDALTSYFMLNFTYKIIKLGNGVKRTDIRRDKGIETDPITSEI